MNPFTYFNQRGATPRLVAAGLLAERKVARGAISNCIYLLAGSLGDSWRSLSRETAAGMVLLALAKDSALGGYLNKFGWELVIGCIATLPAMANSLSPRALLEIDAYLTAARAARLPAAA